MLEVRNVTKSFDGFIAISDVSLDVARNDIHAIIGPNGAGKTTLFNLISGFLSADHGTISFLGGNIGQLRPHAIVQRGISRSFQRANIFPRKTVFENVQVAFIASRKRHRNIIRPSFGLFREEVAELLDLVGLAGDELFRAGDLAYGRQKQLEFAISLASDPKLLLLDEPTAGMSVSETVATMKLIKRITAARDLTVLFTEHDMAFVFGIANQLSVLHHGVVITTGQPEAVRKDPEVIRVYLGKSDEAS